MRKICVVTGARSEYGLLQWLMKEIQTEPGLELQVIATGMHLSPEYGLTYKLIEADGLIIQEKVEMLLSSDTPVGVTKSIGLGVIGFAEAMHRLKPDIIVVLGDRFEIFAAVQAALVARIPVAHLHGGETTEGAIDESIRHAVTKMAHLHFVANDNYRQRVIQLGENPERVFNFGAIGIDAIRRQELLSREEFEKAVGMKLGEITFLVTYHPATLGADDPADAMQELLDAFENFPNARIIFTKPNADTGGRAICRMIDDYVAANGENTVAHTSLGSLRYLSAIKYVDVVIGNSSSGLIEVPFFKKPTVNIGDRQKGRMRASSVIDSEENTAAIVSAIRTALSPDFQRRLKQVVSPYGEGNTAARIVEVLKEVDIGDILTKKFYDIQVAGIEG